MQLITIINTVLCIAAVLAGFAVAFPHNKDKGIEDGAEDTRLSNSTQRVKPTAAKHSPLNNNNTRRFCNHTAPTKAQLSLCFFRHDIVPNVLPTPPPATLHVVYGKRIHRDYMPPQYVADNTSAHPILDIAPASNVSQSKLNGLPLLGPWRHRQNGTLYTLIMIDLDAPSRDNPFNGPWLHLLVVDIGTNRFPVDDRAPDSAQKGYSLLSYTKPAPPQNTGAHRYVFIVYEQSRPIVADLLNSIKDRSKFDVQKFILDFQLKRLVAANFFYVAHPLDSL